MQKANKIFNILFIIITIENLIELNIVRGMFSWIVSLGLFLIVGLINIIINLINKKYNEVILKILLIVTIFSFYLVFL